MPFSVRSRSQQSILSEPHAGVLTWPESGDISFETLPHIANFYHGVTRGLYFVAASYAIVAAANYMGLLELAASVAEHTDDGESPYSKRCVLA